VKYAFIADHRTTWPVAVQCDVLAAGRSGYYAWRKRAPSAAALRRERLTDEIRAAHAVGRATYGSARRAPV
jgi:putative transposase